MPISMSGMASGMDTDAIIEKLVNVESRPIQQLEIRKRNHGNRKEGLKALGRYLEDVNSSARDLYGFGSSFSDKQAVSSDSSALDAKAGSKADTGDKKIKILQLASPHKVSTDPVEEKETLPAGTFTIEVDGATQAINFKGGTLKDLEEKIRETASELVASSYIRKDGSAYVLTLQSKKTGEKGEIRLTGDKDLLTKIGLVDGNAQGGKTEVAVSFDARYFTSYMGEKKAGAENGSIRVGDGGRSVSLQGLVWREYALPVEIALQPDTMIEFDVNYSGQKGDDFGVPRRLRLGPKEKINIKGIILEGYNVERKREGKKEDQAVFDSLIGIGLVSMDKGRRTERIYPLGKDASGTAKIEAGRDFKKGAISKIILYCNRGAMDIANVRIATPKEAKNWYAMKNVIGAPKDARLSLDGVEVTRDRNDNLTDVIRGVDLTLKRVADYEIGLRIEHNADAPVDKIKKFVDAYNKYLDFQRDLTKAAISEKPGEFEKALSQSGLFVGDMTLMRLQSILQSTITDAYVSPSDKPIRMLSQIGVSTGAINADWETIKSGKLKVDEALLRKTISDNPDGVAEFFGFDSDGDGKADNGMAVKLAYVLKPYVGSGKNIIAAKIDLEENSIKLADENIKQKEEHIKAYQDKLKRKFAAMEQAISQTNSQKQWMKYQLGSQEKGSGGGKE